MLLRDSKSVRNIRFSYRSPHQSDIKQHCSVDRMPSPRRSGNVRMSTREFKNKHFPHLKDTLHQSCVSESSSSSPKERRQQVKCVYTQQTIEKVPQKPKILSKSKAKLDNLHLEGSLQQSRNEVKASEGSELCTKQIPKKKSTNKSPFALDLHKESKEHSINCSINSQQKPKQITFNHLVKFPTRQQSVSKEISIIQSPMLTKGINKDDTETSINDLIDSSSERNPSVEGNSSIVRAMSPKQKDKKMPLFVFKKVKPENKAKIKAGNEGGSAFSTDDQKRSDITDKERTTIAAILMSQKKVVQTSCKPTPDESTQAPTLPPLQKISPFNASPQQICQTISVNSKVKQTMSQQQLSLARSISADLSLNYIYYEPNEDSDRSISGSVTL